MRVRSKGFTLIELIVSIAVGTIIFAYVFNLFSTSIRAFDRASKTANNIEIAAYVIDTISKDIYQSQRTGYSSSDIRLSLMKDSDNIVYEYKEGKVSRKTGGSTSFLTMPGDVNDMRFMYPSGAVRVQISTPFREYIFIVCMRNIQ